MAAAGVNFATRPTSGTSTFRLLQTTRAWTQNPGTNLADATTNAGGGTVKVTWGSSGPAAIDFTLGNGALGVTNQSIPTATVVVGGRDVHQVTLADGRILTVYIDTTYDSSTDFVWTAYGNWNITSSTSLIQNSGIYVAGFETPLAGMPSSGSATFNGFVGGTAFVPNGAGLMAAGLAGNAQLNVNWATGAITGTGSSIFATPGGGGPAQAWNSLAFAGTIASGATGFSGTTTITGAPGTAFALTTGAAGNLNGQFYGTTAQEVGAIWSAHDGTRGAVGYLVAKQ